MDGLYQRARSPFYYVLLKDPRTDSGYRRLSTGRTTKSEAEQVARELQQEIDLQIQQDSGLRWIEASESFITRSPIKGTTRYAYASLAEAIATSCLGDFNLRVLSHQDLKRFVAEKRKQRARVHGCKPENIKRNVSDATIKRHLSLISSVVKWSIDQQMEGAPTENVVRTFDRSGLKETKPIDRHLRKGQFEQILSALESDEDRRILTVLVGTGMRTSEFLDLRWGEVDFDQRVIEFGNLDPDRTKSSRARRIPIMPIVFEALTAQCAASYSEDTGYVFPSPLGGGRRYGLSSLKSRVRRVSKIERFRIHDLRHTFASWALQRGVDPFAIAAVLGHADIQTTARYARHISDSALDKFKTSDFLE